MSPTLGIIMVIVSWCLIGLGTHLIGKERDNRGARANKRIDTMVTACYVASILCTLLFFVLISTD